MNIELERGGSRPGVDMRKQYIFEGDFAIKESNFLVVRRSLVRCPNGRMFRLIMLLILIDSKTVCPCFFCCSLSPLTRPFWIGFRAIVDTELTSNGNHLCCSWTALHDFDAIHKYM